MQQFYVHQHIWFLQQPYKSECYCFEKLHRTCLSQQNMKFWNTKILSRCACLHCGKGASEHCALREGAPDEEVTPEMGGQRRFWVAGVPDLGEGKGDIKVRPQRGNKVQICEEFSFFKLSYSIHYGLTILVIDFEEYRWISQHWLTNPLANQFFSGSSAWVGLAYS